jgi:hypothetical protein
MRGALQIGHISAHNRIVNFRQHLGTLTTEETGEIGKKSFVGIDARQRQRVIEDGMELLAGNIDGSEITDEAFDKLQELHRDT